MRLGQSQEWPQSVTQRKPLGSTSDQEHSNQSRKWIILYSGSSGGRAFYCNRNAEMVSTLQACWSKAKTQSEWPQPPQADAYTKTDVLRFKRAAQTLSFRELQPWEVPIGPEGRGGCHGCKHAQLVEPTSQAGCCVVRGAHQAT